MAPALSLSLLLLVAASHPGEAVKCYICDSVSEPKCADPMSDTSMEPRDCTNDILNSAATAFNTLSKSLSNFGSLLGLNTKATQIDTDLVCLKVDYESAKDTKHTLRTCAAPPKVVDQCKVLTEKGVKMDFCETCDTDKCNGSGVTRAILALLIPSLALLLVNS